MPQIKIQNVKVEWAKLFEPDTKFVKPDGEYSMNIIMSEERAAEVCEQLDQLSKDKLDEVVKATPENKRAALAESLSIVSSAKTYRDKDGNTTGEMFFKTKLAAVRTSKEGVKTKQRPLVLDSKKKPMDGSTLIGNDSIVNIVIDVYPYMMQSNKTVGTSLRIEAVQVLSLEEGRKSAASMFDEEDGYVAEAVAKDDAQDTPSFDDSDTTPASEGSDEGDF